MEKVTPELTARDLTYILNSLNATRKRLMDQMGEEAGDEFDDVVMIDDLIARLRVAHKAAGGQTLSEASQG